MPTRDEADARDARVVLNGTRTLLAYLGWLLLMVLIFGSLAALLAGYLTLWLR